jgi:PKD repeat protein
MADADNTPLPSAPVADFTSTTSQLTASFTNASTDADNDISSYAWSFGDGATPGTSDQASPSYTYGAAGTYDVTLTVTDGGGRTNSVTKPVTVSDAAPTQTTVIDNAQPWRYRYVAGAPPAGWNTGLFDSSTWSLGNAVLGFGNASVATNINTFANTTDRPITAYFNKSFNVTDASKAVSLELTTVANDGVVIYVNGTEVGRSNMPTGTVAFNTYASSARNTATANASPVVVNVPVNLLVNGTNTVSAETHLNYRATTDVTFDLKAELPANG